MEAAASLSIRELKEALIQRGIDFSDCLEKSDLVRKYIATTPKPGMVHTRAQTIAGLSCVVWDVVGQEESPKFGVVIMHGFGANKEDLLPIAAQLANNWGKEGKVHLRCIVPDGPLSMGGQSRAWFPLDFMKLLTTPPDQLALSTIPGMDEASDKVASLVDSLRSESFNGVFLSGFSQGAIMSAHTAFRMSDPSFVLGLGLLSCAVQAKASWTEALSGEHFLASSPHLFITDHGSRVCTRKSASLSWQERPRHPFQHGSPHERNADNCRCSVRIQQHQHLLH